MVLVIESITLCVLFTIMVYVMSGEPIKTLYNYKVNYTIHDIIVKNKLVNLKKDK